MGYGNRSKMTAVFQKRPAKGVAVLNAISQQRAEAGIPDDCAVKKITADGETLHIRRMTNEQLAALMTWRGANRSDDIGLAVRMFQMSVCDPQGTLLYADAAAVVDAVTPSALFTVQAAVVRHNGMG